MLILALLDERQRHGYEISQLIEERSNGAITFHTASLYPTLYRLEDQGLIEGRWVERAGQRRRRYCRVTPAGRKTLAKQRLRHAFDANGHSCDSDVLDELSTHAATAFDTLRADGSDASEAERRAHESISGLRRRFQIRDASRQT